MNITPKKKVVILGGGFGGLYTYKGLYYHFNPDEIDVTIVNRSNYFLFTPLLHEVATGGIAHHQVVESIRQIIYKTNDTLHVAEVISIDPKQKIVKTSIAELPYDILIVALGATTNFFNSPGAEKYSFVLKNLDDALQLRTTLIESFEKASEIKDHEERKRELTFAVVGGGATGVELVTEISELFTNTFAKYYHTTIACSDISLYLVNSGPEVLGPFHPSLRAQALEVLKKSGIKVLLNTQVKEVTERGIIVSDDTLIEAKHVVWAAGVKPNTPMFTESVAQDKGGRILVESTLQMKDHPEIFVLGDIASVTQADGRPLPMLAQVAVRQGMHTGRNIKRSIKGKPLLPFMYQSQGELASLGQWRAVANISGIRFSGAFAWFLWRTIYLFKFLSGSKRVKIVVDWTMNIFYPRDITKS